jgi:PAS domain S-box-containing protein
MGRPAGDMLAAQRRAEVRLRESEERFRLLVESVQDYAIFMLDTDGRVTSWNVGAERIKGYRAEEIVGRHFSCFYPPEDVEDGKPERELSEAASVGRVTDEGWRVRRDGSRFWANVVITALRDPAGRLQGFAKVTRDRTEQREAEEELRDRAIRLAETNQELDAFASAVAHDLRAPLRAIDGFGQALVDEYGDRLDETATRYLQRIRASTQRMGELIDGLLHLSRVTRQRIERVPLDITAMARQITDDLREAQPDRVVTVEIADGMHATADATLLRAILENLIGNAWKFTAPHETARIEVRVEDREGEPEFVVRDDGIGFDPARANAMFEPFQRLHEGQGFEGTGIGLATVTRAVARLGGRVRAEGAVEGGARIGFTIPEGNG